MKVRALVVDFDGTLVQSLPYGTAALVGIADRLGLPCPSSVVIRRLWGREATELVRSLFPDTDPALILQAWREYEHRLPPQYPTVPGGREVLRAFREIPGSEPLRAVILHTNRAWNEGLLDRLSEAGLDTSLFDFIRVPGDGVPPKPHPRSLAAILDRLEAQFGIRNAPQVCVVSDQVEDGTMALGGGCRFCGVLTGAATAQDFATLGDGISVIPSIAELPAVIG